MNDALTGAVRATWDDPEPGLTVSFRVIGTPAPQGSKTPFVNRATGHAGIKEAAGLSFTTWRHDVGVAARKAAESVGIRLDGPLELTVVFRSPMPAARPKWIRRLEVVPKDTAPDLSKLIRAVEDSIAAAGLIANDARIATIHAHKVEVADGWSGCDITIRRIVVERGRHQ